MNTNKQYVKQITDNNSIKVTIKTMEAKNRKYRN